MVYYFIILDNVSTDNTYKIVKALEKKNNSLTVIWAPKNKTVVDAYMTGYRNCLKTNSDWILLDYINVVGHVFYKEARTFYDIEELWSDADRTNILP